MNTQPFAIAPDDRAARREQALRDGYLYLPRLLSAEALAPLRTLIDRVLIARDWITASDAPLAGVTDPSLKFGKPDDARWFAFLAEILPAVECRAVAELPALVDVVGELVAASLELHVGTVCRIVSPGDPTLSTPPHQDGAYIKDADHVWTAWIPLVACPRDVGPLAVWPGSNHGGLRDHVGSDNGVAIVPDGVVWATGDLELGDVILFSSRTVHRALDNVTKDRLRVSVDYRYRPHTSAV